jgi:dynein heavy chain
VQPQYEASEVTTPPKDGIFVYGLFIEGAKWNDKEEVLEEQKKSEMHSIMPIIHFLPKERHVPDNADYK